MSYSTSSLSTLSIPLGMRAHQQAKRFQSYHTQATQARQVYLNTLAVMAVQDYLAMMGYDSELGYSGQPIQQTLMDCADLIVSGWGRVECRYCIAGDAEIRVPPEVWGDRLGFIFVQLDDALREAQILGLASSIEQEYFPRSDIVSLERLHELFSTNSNAVQGVEHSIRSAVTQLRDWFQQVPDSWQMMQQSLDLFLTSPDFAYRSPPEINALRPELGRSKDVTLDYLGQPLALSIFLGLRTLPTAETEVWVKVSSVDRSLPLQLRMSILTQEQTEVMTALSNGTEAMQFRFSATSGEQFRLQLALDYCHWHEDFVL